MKTTVNFRIYNEYKEELQILANKRGEKISVIIREIISDYLCELKKANSDNKPNVITIFIDEKENNNSY
ncbi:hypothetical protein MPF19_16525 [Polaribacter sp. Z014]|uniref:hypothetical protein n=1 Tax=Polaribacter sp. Z014 TaxID=2927126 RepID=UPI0020215D13|nr:hypothetical protein [Polaribacter sp. Z014]MCL7765030.1 hypothetical protein [Polaribacter sp. Z014]